MIELMAELADLAEGWRHLANHIREKDKHSPVANELDNCADDLTGTLEKYT